jgi:hypothetical protein
MTNDLQDVRWTIGEAKRQLDDLQAEVVAYLDLVPYRIYTERRGDGYALMVERLREPPFGWSHAVGQIANNARAALDQLIFALAVANGNAPEKVSKWKTQFPIFSDREHYREKRGKTSQGESRRDEMLRGVRPALRRVIDDAQPYEWKGRAAQHPLAILDTITNRHKHRQLHPALAVAESFSVEMWAGGGKTRMTVEGRKRPDVVTGGEPLVTVTPGALGDFKMEPGPNFRITIAFETDDAVVSIEELDAIVLICSRAIDRCERRL